MPGIQAPISHGGTEHDYVISHRRDEHNVSYRPPGKHEHVGTFTTEREAKAAAALHASSSRSAAPQVTKDTKTMSSKKPPAQLNREIAQSLAASGQSQLAAVFADPEARKVFAREMRHELLTQQTSRATAAGLAARPFTYKRAGEGIVGRFATQAEAESWAKSKGGWVEHGDRVVYGTKPSAHATRKAKAPRPTPYRIKLTPSELKALEFARGRYSWPDMLAAHAAENGSVAFTESDMWQWCDDVDSDAEGGHSPFPLAAPAFAEKLQNFYDKRI